MSESSVFNVIVMVGFALISALIAFFVTQMVAIHKSFKRLNRTPAERAQEMESLWKEELAILKAQRIGQDSSDDLATDPDPQIPKPVVDTSDLPAKIFLYGGPEINKEAFTSFIKNASDRAARKAGIEKYSEELAQAGREALEAAYQLYRSNDHGDLGEYLTFHICEAIVEKSKSLRAKLQAIGIVDAEHSFPETSGMKEAQIEQYTLP